MPQSRIITSMRSVYEREHFVQYYQIEEALVDNLVSFIGAGLRNGEKCVVIATQDHIGQLFERLDSLHIDRSKLVAADAHEALSRFMVDGLPNKSLFIQFATGLVSDAVRDGSKVRAFGEMVSVLWGQGNEAAAILLEQLWNDLSGSLQLTLFCAYPARQFVKADTDRVTKLHSCAIVPDSFMVKGGEA
jgi:hypothetical protein